jgi:hypothetical protein
VCDPTNPVAPVTSTNTSAPPTLGPVPTTSPLLLLTRWPRPPEPPGEERRIGGNLRDGGDVERSVEHEVGPGATGPAPVPRRHRALAYVPVAVLVAATFGAAGVSMATTGSPTAPRPWLYPGSQPGSSSDPNQEAALTEARRLVDFVEPAPAWTAVSSPPTPSLAAPMSIPAGPDVVDLTQLWTSQETLAEVQTWVTQHPAVGSVPAGSGSSYQHGVLLATSTVTGYPAVPDRFESRQVLVALAPLAGGGVGIRVDAQVIWYPSRPPLEAIPAGVTAVEATVFTSTASPDSSEDVLAAKTFTDPRVAGLLARVVDSLPVAVPAPRSCPADLGTAPHLLLDFSGGAGVAPVRVRVDTNGCPSVSFTIGHTVEPPLTDNGLFELVDQLLGLDLPSIGADGPGDTGGSPSVSSGPESAAVVASSS